MNLFVFVLPDESRLYWRGPETTATEAESAIRAAGYAPLYVERLK